MMLFPVAILAGGFGTRVASIAQDSPKALLSIANEPFIAHQLQLLASQGLKEIVLCIGHHGEKIKAFVGDGRKWNLSVSYHEDGESLLGTGGAIKSALSQLPNDFFVIYGDSYLQCDYHAVQKAYQNSGKMGLMTVYKNAHQWDKSNVAFDGEVIRDFSKQNPISSMTYIDYGLSVFSKKAFAPFLEKTIFDLSEVHAYLLAKNELAACEVYERFYEAGSLDGIAALEKYISKRSK